MKYIILLCISFLFHLSLSSQNINETYNIGCKFYNEGNYSASIDYFDRVLFFDPNYADKCNVYMQLSNANIKLGNFNRSIYYCDLFLQSSNNDSIKNIAILNKSFVYLYSKQFKYAELELLNIKRTFGKSQTLEYYTYKGIAEFNNNQYDEAYQTFYKAVFLSDSSKINELNNILKPYSKFKRPNAKVVQYMSIFLPGSGQLYAGDFKEGANSLVLTTLFLTLYVQTAIKYSPLDAVLTVFPWYQRYYIGGFQQAKQIALNNQQKKKNLAISEIMNIIED